MNAAFAPRSAPAALAVFFALALTACGIPASPAQPAAAQMRPIPVEDVRVEVGVGSPIPINVMVSGTWPDLCAQLARMEQSVEGLRIEITLSASAARPDCPPDPVGIPFGIAIPLNGVQLPKGTYTVTVNGVGTTFQWPSTP